MKLIVFPLIILIMVAAVAQMGMGQSTYQLNRVAIDSDFVAPSDGYYDVDGHKVMNPNEDWVGERGYEYWTENQLYWQNATNGGGSPDPAGSDTSFPLFDVYTNQSLSTRAETQNNLLNVDVFGSWGLIGIIVGIMALAVVVGLRVFGTGTSETGGRTVVLGTAFLSMWALFSVLSYGLIAQIPVLGPIFYFFITALYCLGILQQVSGGSN